MVYLSLQALGVDTDWQCWTAIRVRTVGNVDSIVGRTGLDQFGTTFPPLGVTEQLIGLSVYDRHDVQLLLVDQLAHATLAPSHDVRNQLTESIWIRDAAEVAVQPVSRQPLDRLLQIGLLREIPAVGLTGECTPHP